MARARQAHAANEQLLAIAVAFGDIQARDQQVKYCLGPLRGATSACPDVCDLQNEGVVTFLRKKWIMLENCRDQDVQAMHTFSATASTASFPIPLLERKHNFQ
jgi:hypothetical protein